MKNPTFLIALLILTLVDCFSQNRLDSIRHKIIGKWISADRLVELSYSENMQYSISRNYVNLFRGNFCIDINGDSVFVYHIYNDITVKNLLFIDGDELIQANYKSGKGINDHIDEVGVFYRKNVNIDSLFNENSDSIQTNYFLLANFKGMVLMSYNQTDGIYKGSENNINVPRSGLSKMKNEADINKFIKRRFRFYFKNQSDYNTEIKVLERNKFYDGVELKKYEEDSVYILPLGYNQWGREEVNKFCKENIKGNVEMFVVDIFKNLIKYLEH